MVRPPQLAPNKARVAEQQARAFAMKSAGATYAVIAKELGISTATAHRRVTDACDSVVVPAVEEYRRLTDAAYDQLLSKLAPGVNAGEIPAVDAARRVWADRRKLLGLDAPVKSEVQVTAQIDANLGEIARVVAAGVIAGLAAIDTEQWWRDQLTRYGLEVAQHEMNPEEYPLPEPPRRPAQPLVIPEVLPEVLEALADLEDDDEVWRRQKQQYGLEFARHRLAVQAGEPSQPPERPKRRLAITSSEPPEPKPPRPPVLQIERDEPSDEDVVQRAFDRTFGHGGPSWQRTIVPGSDPRQNVAGA